MEAHDFLQLCSFLKNSYELQPFRNLRVIKKDKLFYIFTLAQGALNTQVQEHL